MVNADDFTYSKGYLGLLSALGASLGITFCCAPSVYGGFIFRYNNRRHASTKPQGTPTKVDEENIKTHDEALDEWSFLMTEDNAAKKYIRSARFSVDCCDVNCNPRPYRGLRRNHTF